MTTGFHRETATIYQFPVSASATANVFRDSARLAADARSAYKGPVASSSCWYHEEEVREADLPRKP
ncbi:DUF2735 domain-containing protein [Pararhizobium sp.]|uniref:DUF2735 domain-containing protein n=1 Tax=Pararhizobium sp. TaxID=1977563 RepID=UPI00271E16BF|nr:DUF2735 domain-containing protein [Pararhizobium sp.]MDO9416174.1 DUF2735 domain-containing protein [Pararhizobium sp.]